MSTTEDPRPNPTPDPTPDPDDGHTVVIPNAPEVQTYRREDDTDDDQDDGDDQ
jgi:hypothetical protein